MRPHLWRVALVTTLLVAAAPAARASLDVAWDCYLPNGPVSCRDLEGAIFSTPTLARAQDVTTAGARVEVRSTVITDGVSVVVHVTAPNGSDVSLVDRVPKGFSSDGTLLRVVGDVQRAIAPVLAEAEPATVEDGVLHLSLRDPNAGPRSARSDDQATGWYLAPRLSVSAERFGVLELQGRGELEVNWSHPAWRMRGFSWVNSLFVSVDPDGRRPSKT